MLPFGEWQPDQPEFGGQFAREASGVIPEKAGYRPFKGLVTTSSALTARAQGGAWFRAADGTTKNFAGDATKLYLLSGATWGDVSRLVGGAYATPVDGMWRWGQFGNTAYATNGFDALQSFDLAAGTNWVAAAGSPPIGQYITTVRRFLVLANVVGFQQRVHWSGDNNTSTWATSATTLADNQDMPRGGAITGITGGEFGVVWSEDAINRMSFEGSPTVFRFDEIASGVGATIPNTVAGWGPLSFAYHSSGFHMLRGGSEIVPIGKERVDRWFRERLDASYLYRVTCAIDPVNALYVVSFPTIADASGTPTAVLVYNWKADRWAYGMVTAEMIYAGAVQQSYTLEQLDAFGTVDSIAISFDSSYWTGNRQLLLAGFDTSHKSGTFSGANLAATIDTTEMQPTQGKRSRFLAARPMFDGGSPTLAVGVRDTQQAAVTWGADTAMEPSGRCALRGSGRYGRIRAKQAAGAAWTWAQGVDDIDARAQGGR